MSLDRRRFLQNSAVLGGTLLSGVSLLDRHAHAAEHIDAPVVDEVIVREITDSSHDLFAKGFEAPGLAVQRTGVPEAPQGKTLESEWGLALHIESRKGQQHRRYLLDFGFTSDIYANNLEILKIDVSQVDAMIISHGHFDHVGGLMGFLETSRSKMRKDLRLYTGGEDDFCRRYSRQADGSFVNFGTPVDRVGSDHLDPKGELLDHVVDEVDGVSLIVPVVAVHGGSDCINGKAAVFGDIADLFAIGEAWGDPRFGGRQIEERLHELHRRR